MSSSKKLIFLLAPLVLFTVFTPLSSAQDSLGGKQMSVTGCLKPGSGASDYYLMGQDGKMYELWGKNLGQHLNHKVTVTGTPATVSHADEQKRQATEKAEAGSATYVDMKVTSLKMISESCQ